MGACATKSGDLKVKGEPPLVAEDAATAPPVAEGEKSKADGVPEADPADVSRRRSLSVLLKEDAEASDGEAAGQEAPVKIVTVDEDAAVATEEAEAPAVVKVVTDENAAVATEEAGAPAAVKVVTDEDAAVATEEAGAPASLSKEEVEEDEAPQAAVEPSVTVVVEQDTAKQPAAGDDGKGDQQEPGVEAKAEEEEKRVDPDSVQVAVAVAAAPTPSANGSQDPDGASA